MIKQLVQFLFIPLLLSACLNSAGDKEEADLSKAVIQAVPTSISLEVNTKTINGSRPLQTVIFTNIGRQPVTDLVIKGFKDESAPLVQTSTCSKELAAGGSCEVKIRLETSHKLASSATVSRSTVMTYEYNNSSEKKTQKLNVRFKLEKWIASVFITHASTNGQIEYTPPENMGYIKAGSDSADYYCKVDKNNPHNGYYYKALIYDTTQTTPYLHWVLYGGNTYYSVMPDVYHQKVWQTSYKQATTNKILANVYNCIGLNCVNNSKGDEAAWVGLQLDNNKMDMDTCGTAGNAWKSGTSQFLGRTFAIVHDQNSHLMTMVSERSGCDMQKKIICVSM